jgi:Ca2+-binding RTX toxin-like protein
MAWIIPIENTNTDVDLTTTDSLYIGEDIYFAARATGIGSRQQILVDGKVAYGGGTIFSLGGAGTTDNLIHIGETGRVNSMGIYGNPNPAIGMSGKSGKIINDVIITATNNEGVGIVFAGTDPDAAFSVVNTGILRAGSIGILAGNIVGSFTLTNTGTIIGGEGQVTAPDFTGAILWGSFTSVAVDNDAKAILDSQTIDTIYNSGRMVGDINLSGGADYYEGRNGTVEGDVYGGGGADRLFSGLGNDRLFGGDGADMLMGGVGGDLLDGGAGTDTVLYTTAAQGVTASLSNAATNTGDAAGDSYVSIENLTGSNYNDVLVGNGANNILSGGNGNDTLRGAAGNDVLAGGAGRDIFIFAAPLNAATNVDRINDFNVADDTMQLENTYFTALSTTGVLTAGAFQANTSGVASDSSDRIIYETDTGNLYYDADGLGGVAGILFAKLATDLQLTNADFVVI